MTTTPRLDLRKNPFFVLELPATATTLEVHQRGQKLVAQLELGGAKAKSYWTPFGTRTRDVDDVRLAVSQLGDARVRAAYARFVVAQAAVTTSPVAAPPPLPAWPEVWRALWWADDVEGRGP
jgi:hypothetical protein